MNTRIYGFADAYAFLSNFSSSMIVVEGAAYPTVEHAFQALKTLDVTERDVIRRETTPGRAKRAGRAVALRPDWERVKDDVMLTCLRAKFTYAELRAKLLATGDAELIEANTWGDRVWGVDRATGVGENRLGRALMRVREEARQSAGTDAPLAETCALPRCRQSERHVSFCAHFVATLRCAHCGELIYSSDYAGGLYHFATHRERCGDAYPDCFATAVAA